MIRFRLLPILVALTAMTWAAQDGTHDPAFDKVPFEEWLRGGKEAKWRWKAGVSPATLTNFERMGVMVGLEIDGLELAQRKGQGELVILMQVRDEEGRVYQDHGTIDLNKMQDGVKAQMVTYSHPIFVRPGKYQLAVALYYPAGREHAVKHSTFTVKELGSDPLPDSWSDLPPVEFLRSAEPPDSWFQPLVTGRLHLPVSAHRPLNVEVLLNITPSERFASSTRVRDRNLQVLIPAVRSILEIEIPNSRINITWLDLARRRQVFRQSGVRNLDWERARQAFANADLVTIDLKSLEDRSRTAGYFVREVERSLRASDATIVLSGPLEFQSGQASQPVTVRGSTEHKLFYIRYEPVNAPSSAMNREDAMRPRSRARGGLSRMPVQARRSEFDQLEPAVKAMNPRLFDVQTPLQFRKALAQVLEELANL